MNKTKEPQWRLHMSSIPRPTLKTDKIEVVASALIGIEREGFAAFGFPPPLLVPLPEVPLPDVLFPKREAFLWAESVSNSANA